MHSRFPFSTSARGVIAALSLALAAAMPTVAQTVTYTFDGGGFTMGSVTPLTNAVPDLDPANISFTATFAAADAGAFTVTNTNYTPGSGFALFELEDTDALSVTLSTPVTSVSLDFAVDGDPSTSLLVLTDGNGGTMNYTGGGGGDLDPGSLKYMSATPFTSFTLQGLTQPVLTTQLAAVGVPQAPSYIPTGIEADNFVFAVPEPGTDLAVLLATAVMLAGARRLTRTRVA